MSRYKILDQQGINFVTLTVVEWIDVFVRKKYKDIIIESLQHCQNHKGLIVHAFVIMTSHIHLIVSTKEGYELSNILRDIKKFTSTKILSEIKNGGFESRKEWLFHKFAYNGRISSGNRNYKFWQSDNHPILLYNLHVIAQKVDYIHNNPVQEGWVLKPEDYIYSSASNYLIGEGVLELVLFDFPGSWVGYLPS
jgi:putative transposase